MGLDRRRWMKAALGVAGGSALLWGASGFIRRMPEYRVVNRYPHDPKAFCQGLVFADGFLYESTGRFGQSSLRKVDWQSGKVLLQVDLPTDVFAEGLIAWQDTLVQLTWRSGAGFIYDRASMRRIDQFTYSGEGWGLTHDDNEWIMSDGTSTLRRIDPKSRRVTGTLRVTEAGRPLPRLNELEYIDGEIYANIWQSDRIVRIAPTSGEVVGSVDLRGILPGRVPGQLSVTEDGVDVLNGIAYDNAGRRLFVTGKNWPTLFEIEIVSNA